MRKRESVVEVLIHCLYNLRVTSKENGNIILNSIKIPETETVLPQPMNPISYWKYSRYIRVSFPNVGKYF